MAPPGAANPLSAHRRAEQARILVPAVGGVGIGFDVETAAHLRIGGESAQSQRVDPQRAGADRDEEARVNMSVAPARGEWAVDLRSVRKTYGKVVQALRGVDVRVGSGEIFGLLGPNGAGKSTLVKIMMTVVRADQVEGTVLGRPVGHRETMGRVGYLPESHRFPGYLTGAQLLDYYAALAKVSRADRRRRSPSLLERVGLRRWAQTRISGYSKGMLQRLGIAQALMNDPDLVVLDEPTDGLDPVGRRDVRKLLLDLRAEGKTVFLNSHLLGELEQICDSVVILVAGEVARQGKLSDLMARSRAYRIIVDGELSPALAEIERRGGRLDGNAVILEGEGLKQVNVMIDLLRARGLLIESVVPHRSSLEDIFLMAMGEQGGAVGAALPVARPSKVAQAIERTGDAT
ncbi:MAG: ABC transporter ATP-binding protein [Phycisphaerae bacterium]